MSLSFSLYHISQLQRRRKGFEEKTKGSNAKQGETGASKKNKEKGRVCSVAEPKNASNPAQACKLSDRESIMVALAADSCLTEKESVPGQSIHHLLSTPSVLGVFSAGNLKPAVAKTLSEATVSQPETNRCRASASGQGWAEPWRLSIPSVWQQGMLSNYSLARAVVCTFRTSD